VTIGAPTLVRSVNPGISGSYPSGEAARLAAVGPFQPVFRQRLAHPAAFTPILPWPDRGGLPSAAGCWRPRSNGLALPIQSEVNRLCARQHRRAATRELHVLVIRADGRTGPNE
jgi:hypothetical protein